MMSRQWVVPAGRSQAGRFVGIDPATTAELHQYALEVQRDAVRKDMSVDGDDFVLLRAVTWTEIEVPK